MTTKIDGTAGIEFPDSSVQASAAYTKAEMNDQTWQDMTASRAIGTTYTNNTGRPIQVAVLITITPAGSSIGVEGVINGGGNFNLFNANAGSANHGVTVLLTVPVGATYNVSTYTGSAVTFTWRELRN